MKYQILKDSIHWTRLTSTTTTPQEQPIKSLQEIVNAGTVMHDSLAFHDGVEFGVEIRPRHEKLEERQIGISYNVVRPVITLLRVYFSTVGTKETIEGTVITRR